MTNNRDVDPDAATIALVSEVVAPLLNRLDLGRWPNCPPFGASSDGSQDVARAAIVALIQAGWRHD